MKAPVWFLTCIALSFSAHAEYDLVDGSRPPGDVATGACGKPLPPEQSRKVRNIRLLCGGAQVDFLRTPVKSPFWDDWSRLDRGDGSGALSTRQKMQAARLQEEKISWTGTTKVKTYEAWDYSVRMRGANRDKCRTWTENVPCQKVRHEPIMENRCHYVPDPVPVIPVPSGGGGNGGGSYGGGNSGSRGSSGDAWSDRARKGADKDRPDLGRRMDPGSRIDRYDSPRYSAPSRPSSGGSSSSGSSGGGGSYRGNYGRRGSIDMEKMFQEFLGVTSAQAGERCGPEIVGYRDIPYMDVCPVERVDTCEWEETRSVVQPCSEETLNYTVEYQKPDLNSWSPGKPAYHDLLPNKYDLLPGEWEKVHLLVNRGQNDETAGIGRSTTINPKLEFDNQWNEYTVNWDNAGQVCRMNTPINLKGTIVTEKRKIRKAPNSLAIPIDQMGRERALEAAEYYFPDGERARLRPTRIMLEDTSNEVMMAASRQSRKFEGLDPEVTVTTFTSNAKPATAKEMGFWKNTLLKVKLIEKPTCKTENEKIFADVLNTTSKYTKIEDNGLLIPLDGSQGDVDSFYQPYGWIGRAIKHVFGPIDLQPNPGMNYEFRVSMQQQGLPFYENGCKDGAATCDDKDANPNMYSEELVIKFTANKRKDDRGWVQRFENWYSKKPWNKFSSCGGEE